MANYYLTDTPKVGELKYFPFSTFEEFVAAVMSGDVIDMGVQMDVARNWAMSSSSAPSLQRTMKTILAFTPIVMALFYLVMVFVMNNYWLLLFIPLSVIVFFMSSPITRRFIPIHWLLLIGLIIMWIVSKHFPHPVYWLPILLEYKVTDYLYKGSAQLVRRQVQIDENLLSWFWKWGDLSLYLKNGEEWSQRGIRKDGKYDFYKDIDTDWKDYVDKRYKK